MVLSTPTKYNSKEPTATPPGIHHNAYHDQCLTHGLSAAASAPLDAITLTKSNIHKYEIPGSGATRNFMMTRAHVDSKELTADGVTVSLLDGNKVKSTHRCTVAVDIPGLPQASCRGHIIPGLALHLLMSVVTLCNTGCEVTFNKTSVRVTYNGNMIITGRKCQRTGLWMAPLNPLTNQTVTPTHETTPKYQAPTDCPTDRKQMPSQKQQHHKAVNIVHTMNTSSKVKIQKITINH